MCLGTGYAGPVAVGGADVTTDVILAAMSLLGTLAGTFGGILVSQRLTTYRLELLEREVREPVSYTHLDVYKRQRWYHSRASVPT